MAIDQTAALAKLEQANQDRLKKEYSGKAGTKFVTEVKESMLFQYNWAELLSAAPTALSLLGACHVASSSNEAAAINLGSAMPKGGWQYLKVAEKPTLKACLVFVGDQGAKAFKIAGSNMDAISSTSGDLTSTVSLSKNYSYGFVCSDTLKLWIGNGGCPGHSKVTRQQLHPHFE